MSSYISSSEFFFNFIPLNSQKASRNRVCVSLKMNGRKDNNSLLSSGIFQYHFCELAFDVNDSIMKMITVHSAIVSCN